jgi:hypothetical protein
MVFFRLDRAAQIAVIGAALAAGPGCYGSHGDDEEDDADGGDARDAQDARDDVFVVDDVPDAMEVRDDADDGDVHVDYVPDAMEVRDDAGGREDFVVDDVPDAMEVRDDAEPDYIVDCVPYPMCTAAAAATLSTSAVESLPTHAVAEVRIAGLDAAHVECSAPPCLEVVPEGGAGTVSDVTAVAADRIRFRYENEDLGWDPVRLDLTWRVACVEAGSFREETARGTAWACRDTDDRIMIVADPGACPGVADPPPPPMARVAAAPRPSARGDLELRAAPHRTGEWRISALGPRAPSVSYRWVATGGILRLLSNTEALFSPAPDADVSMVQVAAFTPSGVTVKVFRRRRG